MKEPLAAVVARFACLPALSSRLMLAASMGFREVTSFTVPLMWNVCAKRGWTPIAAMVVKSRRTDLRRGCKWP